MATPNAPETVVSSNAMAAPKEAHAFHQTLRATRVRRCVYLMCVCIHNTRPIFSSVLIRARCLFTPLLLFAGSSSPVALLCLQQHLRLPSQSLLSAWSPLPSPLHLSPACASSVGSALCGLATSLFSKSFESFNG